MNLRRALLAVAVVIAVVMVAASVATLIDALSLAGGKEAKIHALSSWIVNDGYHATIAVLAAAVIDWLTRR